MTVASRDGFFEAAMRLLAREGRAGLRLAPLCRAVGVTSGSFYHHFGSWDAFVDVLLEHWERTETRELADLADRASASGSRLDALKHLALTFPHEAEAAIRAWAHGDARVAAVQRRVDDQRHAAIVVALGQSVPDPTRRERLASLALAVLIGRQQMLRTVDVGELQDLFDDLVERERPRTQ